MVRQSFFGFGVVFGIVLFFGRPACAELYPSAFCEENSAVVNEWHSALHELHSEFLAPEVAQLATEVRLAWITLASSTEKKVDTAAAMKRVPVLHFSKAIRALLKQSSIYFRWNAARIEAMDDPRAHQALHELKLAYGEVEKIRAEVEVRGFANYYEMRFLTELASQIGAHPNSLGWHYAIRKPFENEFDDDGMAEFFRVPISLASPSGIHLGFRALNDVSAALVGFIEIPDLMPDQSVAVDGVRYEFASFVDHDIGHARDAYQRQRRDLPRHEWPRYYIEALRERIGTYRRVRAALDQIKDRRSAVLAEGVWFGLDHEYNLAYRGGQWLALPTPAYLEISSLSETLYRRFTDRADLGQAFKDSSWLREEIVVEQLRHFESLTSRRFLPGSY